MTVTSRADERTPLVPPRNDERAELHDESDPQKLPAVTRNLILASAWIGVFLGALDTTVVASLATDISSSFQASQLAGWLGTGYLLTTATFTPLTGKLADIVGRRYASLLSLALFTLGTLLCGLAPSMFTLILGRLIAGMGGGGLMAISSIIASDLVPLKKRGLIQGVANLFYGTGAALGGPLGGFIADTFSWRVAFLCQIPFLVAAFVLIFLKVRYIVPGQGKSKREMLRRIDYGGSFSLIGALGSLLFALSYKNNEGLEWKHPLVWGLSVVSALFWIAFIVIERRAPEPVMPLTLLASRNGAFVSLGLFGLSFAVFSLLFFLPQHYEIVRQMSASAAGAHLVPNSIALSCGSLFSGWVMRRTGHYHWLLIISGALPFVTFVILSFLDENSPPWLEWISVLPSGFGFASLLTGTLIALISSVDRQQMATATGLSYLARYVGQVIGVACSSALLQSVLTASLTHRIVGPGADDLISRIRRVPTSINELSPSLQQAARASYHDSLRAVFMMNAGMAALSFLCMFMLKEFPLPNSFAEERSVEERSGAGTPREELA